MDKSLHTALLQILRPLVRHLIGRGWTFPVLSDLLRSVYVAEAQAHFGDGPQSVTDSRISLLSGIHRKEVKRLRAELAANEREPALRRDAGLAARVVAGWLSLPRYLDARKRPKTLPLGARGNRASFERLVRETRADMRPNVILEELVRVGVATIGRNNTVSLVRSAYVSDLPQDKLAYLGDNVSDHLQSALHNLAGPGDPFLERAVYYELVAPEALERLRPELFRLSEHFLQDVNRKVMPMNSDAIRRGVPNGRRMRLGVFYFEDKSRVAAGRVRRRKAAQARQP